MNIYRKVRSGLIYYWSMRQLRLNGRLKDDAIYLTFDDGPEPGITEFVLNVLANYKAKATFFCIGKNIEKYPLLYKRIMEEGHSIGSHTYSHLHAHRINERQYLNDAEYFDSLVSTRLFRPPWGALTFKTYLSLNKNKEIVLWHLSSNDFALNKFELQRDLENLKRKTVKGKIILFHFCNRHENETRQILPLYLNWLYNNGYKCSSL